MKIANNIYRRALNNGVELESTCVGITLSKWEQLMKGATRANRRTVTKIAIAAGVADPVEATSPHYNPYNHYKTETHIIYVNSAIEHFLRIN